METDTSSQTSDFFYKCNHKFKSHDKENLNKINNIYICASKVNIDGNVPFIRYLLTNHNINGEIMDFPMVPKLPILRDIISCVHRANSCLDILIPYSSISGDQIKYNGYYIFNDNIYLFYDITKCDIKLDDTYRANNVWLILVDEIVNHKHMCNIPIHDNVVSLLSDNDELCFLVDKNNKNFEIPVVGYVPQDENKLSFVYTFGQTASDKNGIFGPFFYFTDFFTSFVKYKIEDPYLSVSIKDTNFGKKGIVRFALFLGIHKNIENHPNDPIDESDIKTQRLDDPTLDTKMEQLTMRISDHDGLWTRKYDSVYLGAIMLDDGTQLKRNLLAITNRDQQVPLSYHYIDNNTTIECDKNNFRIE